MKTVSIIIVNWNNCPDLLACLESLKSVKCTDFLLNLIVADNASTDNTVMEVKKKYPEVKLIINQKNLGFAQGNNVAIARALEQKSDYLLLLNNDTLVHEDFLVHLYQRAESDLSLALLSPKIYFAKGNEYHKDRYRENDLGKVIWYAGGKIDWLNILCSHRGVDEVDSGQFAEPGITDFATGCCMFIRTSVIHEIGLFDKRYFMYYEDVDLSRRAVKKGYRIFFEPKSVIWHKNAASSGKPGSAMHNYYLTRNRLLFGMLYAKNHTKLALLKDAIRIYKRNLPGERQGVVDFFLGKYGPRT